MKLLSVPRAALLLVISAVVMLATGDPRLGSPAQGQAKPNIVFVLTDDQFPGTENSMPALKNNITSQGIKFTNMISTFPLCCPGRATILRGQYPHNTQIYGNERPLGGWSKFQDRGLQKSTMATWLNGAGYQTGLFGKYMNNYTVRAIPPGWDRWYAWNGANEGWSSLNDQGVQKPLIPQEADSGVSDAALRFLDNRVSKSAPVFAFVNFGAEHEPYYHAQADADKFKGAGVPRTPAFNEGNVLDKPSKVGNLPRLSNSEISALDQGYRKGLRSLLRVDRFVGRASDLLRSKGEMRDTYFVFYTDNGAHFGQHRLDHGKLQPYEEDVNFPLIVRGPGVPRGVKSGKLVGNHDIAPTLARIGGANVPAFVDGRSFLPIAHDPTTDWPRTAIASERKTTTNRAQRWDMLRMGGKVYTRFENGEKEYYNLKRDPYQVHNAFGASDTDYPPPDYNTWTYYGQRLNALRACSGHGDGTGSCRSAENAPQLPMGTVP